MHTKFSLVPVLKQIWILNLKVMFLCNNIVNVSIFNPNQSYSDVCMEL